MAVEAWKNFRMSVDGKLLGSKLAIQEAVCFPLDYCARRRAGTFEREGLQLAIAVADALVTIATQIPLPVTSVSVYLVKTQLLDRMCECGSIPPEGT